MLGTPSNLVDVYKVQASDLKEYQQLKTYQHDETFIQFKIIQSPWSMVYI